MRTGEYRDDPSKTKRGIYLRGKIYWVMYAMGGRVVRESSKSTSRIVAEKLLIKRTRLREGNALVECPLCEETKHFREFPKMKNKLGWCTECLNTYYLTLEAGLTDEYIIKILAQRGIKDPDRDIIEAKRNAIIMTRNLNTFKKIMKKKAQGTSALDQKLEDEL